MKIQCMGCQNFVFDIELDQPAFAAQPVISLTCPKCGSSTALQAREGGGVEIGLDKHLKSAQAAK